MADVLVRDHHALGRAGGAGGVDQQRDVIGARRLDLAPEPVAVGLMDPAPGVVQLVEKQDLPVREVVQAVAVDHDALRHLRHPVADGQELLELLLVLDDAAFVQSRLHAHPVIPDASCHPGGFAAIRPDRAVRTMVIASTNQGFRRGVRHMDRTPRSLRRGSSRSQGTPSRRTVGVIRCRMLVRHAPAFRRHDLCGAGFEQQG